VPPSAGRVGPEHQSSRRGRGEQRRPLRRRVGNGSMSTATSRLLAGHHAQRGRSRELDFYGAMEPPAGDGDLLATTRTYTGDGRPLFGDPYKQIGERVEAVKAQRLLQEEEEAPSPGDRRRRCSFDWALTGKSTWK